MLTPDKEPHDGRHPSCPQCFAEKIHSLQFQGMGASARRIEDGKFAADMDAYQRLRRNGVQPRGIGNSAELEAQAMEKVEIERGIIVSDPIRREFVHRVEDGAGVS